MALDSRLVQMTDEQFRILDEHVIPGLVRDNDHAASAALMALALGYQFTPAEPTRQAPVLALIRGDRGTEGRKESQDVRRLPEREFVDELSAIVAGLLTTLQYVEVALHRRLADA